jgi:hypothetical protein
MKLEHLIPVNIVDIAKQLENCKEYSSEKEYLLQRLEAVRDFTTAVIERNSKKRK